MIRTRFAPSPTGLLHIGGVRTALFSWAYAMQHQGDFLLRIEDTDLGRSTEASVAAILEGMAWVGLSPKEAPIYQTQRFARYRTVIDQLLASGDAYYCYESKEALEATRLKQEAAGEKPRYNHVWRPEPGKALPNIPEDVRPIVRFKNPLTGSVIWHDAVKGRIEISNEELDDLVIARSDGSPTYNFCVVVDDLDMNITHVIRGDDHVNNTPRQINILNALHAPLPVYAHLPMILNADGQKMSKRRDPVSVTDFDTMGILPKAMLNYLARLGWGHGDEEIFTLEQFVSWFDLSKISPSPSRFDMDKLLWTNAQHLKFMPAATLADRIRPRLSALLGSDAAKLDEAHMPTLAQVADLIRSRGQDLNILAQECDYFYRMRPISTDDATTHITASTLALMARFRQQLASLSDFSAESIHALFKPFCAEEGIKMGQLGLPLRLLTCGTTQTPSIDATLALLGQATTLARLDASLSAYAP